MSPTYAWAGGTELLHLLPGADADSVIIALPPFEEANRVRALAAMVARRLAKRGHAVAIPDLPGTGESLAPTEGARLGDWRAAFAAAAAAMPGRCHGVSFRGGALIDVDAPLVSRWTLAPQPGSALVRELERLCALGDGLAAGNPVAPALLQALAAAEPSGEGPRRIVRLRGDDRPADRNVEGARLWRQAEPGNDAALAAVLADDIADWIASCGR